MTVAALRADCARCAALCCVAFAFEPSADFAVRKDAGAPCPNLDACGGCAIYRDRPDRGFGGCVQYDCLGAGQRVVQETFGGRSWLKDPALLSPMLGAFELMRRVHQSLALLAAARDAGLPDRHQREIARLEQALQSVAQAAARPSAATALPALDRRIDRFLASLRPHFTRRAG
jgi:hypothetical protein